MKIRGLFIMAAIFALFLAGCGHYEGSNPVGITGGAEDGYGGGLLEVFQNENGGNGGYDSQLVGDWYYMSGDYMFIYTFQSDGDINIVVMVEYSTVAELSGTFSSSGNQLTMRLDGEVSVYTYSIQSNRLTLTDSDNMTIVLIKY